MDGEGSTNSQTMYSSSKPTMSTSTTTTGIIENIILIMLMAAMIEDTKRDTTEITIITTMDLII